MGRVRIGDGSLDKVIGGSAVFCTTDKGCGPCPDGSNPPIERTRIAPESVLAVSGGTDGTSGSISGHPLEEFCKTSPPPSFCPDGPPAADAGGSGARLASVQMAQCSPPPDDEFCPRYRDYLAWGYQHRNDSLTQELAYEVVRRMTELKPFAPDELLDDVEVYIQTFGTYATVDEPGNVPSSGPPAARLGIATMAMYAYCGIPLDATS
jgi:hypothetical protein